MHLNIEKSICCAVISLVSRLFPPLHDWCILYWITATSLLVRWGDKPRDYYRYESKSDAFEHKHTARRKFNTWNFPRLCVMHLHGHCWNNRFTESGKCDLAARTHRTLKRNRKNSRVRTAYRKYARRITMNIVHDHLELDGRQTVDTKFELRHSEEKTPKVTPKLIRNDEDSTLVRL